jgi:hypothetical protein
MPIMKRLVAAFFVLAALIISGFQNARGEHAEKEARAVFAKLVQAAQAKNTAEFKSYIAKKDLQEMEKEGWVDMMMELVAGEDPGAFTAEVKKDQVVFKKEIKVDTAEEKSTQKTTVHMIKDNGQWKFGKPRNE